MSKLTAEQIRNIIEAENKAIDKRGVISLSWELLRSLVVSALKIAGLGKTIVDTETVLAKQSYADVRLRHYEASLNKED